MKLLVVSGSRALKTDAERRLVQETIRDVILAWKVPGETYLMHGACALDANDWDGSLDITDKLKGADRFAHELAMAWPIPVMPMPAYWWRDGKLDRGAGHMRNAHMAKVAEQVFRCGWAAKCAAFPKGSSPGTRGLIRVWPRMINDPLVFEVPA